MKRGSLHLSLIHILLRSMGNSFTPLIFLIISSVINIVLDYVFVVPFQMGVGGAAYATIIAQGVSAVGITVYTLWKVPEVRISRRMFGRDRELFRMIVNQSLLTSVQQSIMNLGILMVQGLVTVSYTHLIDDLDEKPSTPDPEPKPEKPDVPAPDPKPENPVKPEQKPEKPESQIQDSDKKAPKTGDISFFGLTGSLAALSGAVALLLANRKK